MWFPYSLPTSFKVEGDRQRANDSQIDDTPREFLIAYQLRNPISSEWSVELQLTEPKTRKWKEASGNHIHISFFPNEGGRLSEVVCKLTDTRLSAAVERTYSTVCTFLNYWSSVSGRGFSVAGLRAADLKHDARWRAMPHWPSALELPFDIPDSLPADFWSAAQLYREGRTSSNDRHRFLCCLALINRWSRAEQPFDWRRDASPLATALALATISQEFMALSGAMRVAPELEGLPLEDLPRTLASWHEKALGLTALGAKPLAIDDFNSAQEWAAIANVADIAAHTALSRTITYWRQHALGNEPTIHNPTPSASDVS